MSHSEPDWGKPSRIGQKDEIEVSISAQLWVSPSRTAMGSRAWRRPILCRMCSDKCSVSNGLRVRKTRRRQVAYRRLQGPCATHDTSDADLLSGPRIRPVRRCAFQPRQEPAPVSSLSDAHLRPLCSGASVSWRWFRQNCRLFGTRYIREGLASCLPKEPVPQPAGRGLISWSAARASLPPWPRVLARTSS